LPSADEEVLDFIVTGRWNQSRRRVFAATDPTVRYPTECTPTLGSNMPIVAQALKEEITGLARREVRLQVDRARKTTSRHQRGIAEPKRQVRTLEGQVSA
jgi:hypothetical protein